METLAKGLLVKNIRVTKQSWKNHHFWWFHMLTVIPFYLIFQSMCDQRTTYRLWVVHLVMGKHVMESYGWNKLYVGKVGSIFRPFDNLKVYFFLDGFKVKLFSSLSYFENKPQCLQIIIHPIQVAFTLNHSRWHANSFLKQ